MSPIIYKWDAAAKVMRPLGRFDNLLGQFDDGEHYRLAEVEDRSLKSHSHFFAAIKSGWDSLPEEYAHEFATPEHLRKWLLIRTGWHDRRSIVAASKAEAQRIAAFVRPMDEFAVVQVQESTVTIYTAKSQSMRAMGKEAFQKSKTDCLDMLDGMLGVDEGATAANAGQAA